MKGLRIAYPMLLALALVGGVFLGQQGGLESAGDVLTFNRDRYADKFSRVVTYVEQEYVDSVDTEAHVEKAIQTFLQDLDPHSYYIPASERAEMSEPLQGNFDGIGVEFRIVEDTIMVINPISGGPSESVGILAGDRIVMVEDSVIAGTGITNRKVMELLRGERDSKVSVHVLRQGKPDLLQFTITRGEIPIISVPVAFMTDERTGFIRVSRFARTTEKEFNAAIKSLDPNMDRLVLDLRGNGGGYMDIAIAMVDEFLESNRLIVYLEGKSQERRTHNSTSRGELEDVEVIVLINENSASASEIVAGALQDNDRGTIIGRRSFGKGLVQNESEFDDNSAMRLTIARYYTPSGRSIQKPYGEDVDYAQDHANRMERGEYLSADSISFPDSLKYTTIGGRTVYGGGGIMPDIFVPVDTTANTDFLADIVYNGVMTEFTFAYADAHRAELEASGTPEQFASDFEVDEHLFEEFLDFAEEKGYSPKLGDLARSKADLKSRIRSGIARVIWGDDGYFRVFLQDDDVFKAAMAKFKSSE